MKKTIFILGIAAAAMAVSCNKEEAKINETKTFDGDRAYVVVNINGVGTAQTRATSGDTDFKVGTTAERAVQDAHFYFYDADGAFVTEASAWNETGVTYEDGYSVEFAANTVVTLTGLTQKSYPSYVVTVLNRPSTLTSAPATLDSFADELEAASELNQLVDNTYTYFTMTTSSYVGTDNTACYYATPLVDANFSEEPITYASDEVTPTNCTPVVIYVERLAAKATVAVDVSDESQLTTTTIGGTTYYTITESVLDGDEATDETLYVTFDGWKLNATAKQSYVVKNINDQWTDTSLGFTWNDATNCRSYWCMSYNYGLGQGTDYPSSSNGYTDGSADADALSQYLTYVSLEGGTHEVGASSTNASYLECEYCAENTNTAAIEAIPSALTSILIKATVYTYDEENDEAPVATDFIRHDGQIYTVEHYLAYALEHVPECWLQEESTNDNGETVYTYTLLDTSFLTLVTTGGTNTDGYVSVALKDDYNSSDVAFVVLDDNGEPTGTTYGGDQIQYYLTQFNTNYGTDANYFNGGEMYYNIPIQHLNNTETTVDSDGNTVYNEANYGVVRNHWYHLTVTSLASLGHGIANSEEVIVPTPDTATYYIGAQVNIIEWRYVYWNMGL
ncbi:MAG: Mfa1 family fimbria major subunit [Bacteroidales bacterium]|nr:Mfa1 family fimbria major subunit [Bacteroidales bacterium]